MSSQSFDGHGWQFGKGPIHLDGRRALAYARIRHTTNSADSDISRTERQQRVLQALMHQLVTPSSLLHLPSVGRSIAKPLATDLSANELLGMGWIKFRSGRTLECHLGGTPLVLGGQDVLQSSEQNAAVVQMFLGTSAPPAGAQGPALRPRLPGFPRGPLHQGGESERPGRGRNTCHGDRCQDRGVLTRTSRRPGRPGHGVHRLAFGP